jgi:hypothetical protein
VYTYSSAHVAGKIMYAVCKMEEPPPTETGVCGTLVVWEIFKKGESAIYIYI